MIVVTNRIKVAEGYEDEFEERFRSRLGLVDRMPGFIRNEVLRPIIGDCYVVKTYWESREAFEAWKESDSFKKAHSRPVPEGMFLAPGVVEIHEVIISTEGSGKG